LGVVYDKWTVQLIYALAAGTRRYGELQRELGEITPKVLTETLRQLEYDGLVQRTVYPVVPPKVEYSLTVLGGTFLTRFTVFANGQWIINPTLKKRECDLRHRTSKVPYGDELHKRHQAS